MKGSRKRYAIVGSVPLNKLEHTADSRREAEVINVKADSGKIKELLAQKG